MLQTVFIITVNEGNEFLYRATLKQHLQTTFTNI